MHVCALIVTYGDRFESCQKVINRCFSIGIHRIFLVENGVDKAAGESFQALARNDERLFRLCLNENLGSAGGFSEGIKAVTSNMSDGHVLVLDDDNLPAKNMLTLMSDTYAKLKIQEPTQKFVLYGYRGEEFRDDLHAVELYGRKLFQRDNFVGFSLREALRRRARKLLGGKKDKSDLIVCDHGPWGGMFTSIDTLRSAPAPDCKFYLYGEDTNFSLTLTDMGVQLFLVPAATITDLTSTFVGPETIFSPRLPAMRAFYSCRNSVYNSVSRRRSKIEYTLNKFIFLAIQLCRELLVNGSNLGEINERFALVAEAIRDGESGVLGKKSLVHLSRSEGF